MSGISSTVRQSRYLWRLPLYRHTLSECYSNTATTTSGQENGAELTEHDIKQLLEKVAKVKFIRSSGPGGQNVNKVSTCVELRLDLRNPTVINTLPSGAIQRLKTGDAFLKQLLEKTRVGAPVVNKEEQVIVRCEEDRTQVRNREMAMWKLIQLVKTSLTEPKERQLWTTIGPKGRTIRKQIKTHRATKKQQRSRKDF